MPYVTGNANSLSDIVTALRNACTTNGWTLAGEVLYKDGCYVRVRAIAKTDGGAHPDFGLIEIQPGNGIDGSNNLTDTPPLYGTNWPACGVIGPMATAASASVYNDWDWPVTYYIHIHENPDEVFLMVNYGSSQYWQGLSFGQSPAPGCPGTGNWCYASNPRGAIDAGTGNRVCQENKVVVNPGGSQLSTYWGGVVPGAIPFWGYVMDQSGSVPNPGLFHGVWMNDGVTTGWSHPRYYWNSSGNPSTAMNVVCSALPSQPLPTYSPNTWNNEAHLIRLQILSPRLEWKSSVVGEVQHARFVRNDFLNDGEVITIGPDKWKVYPAYRKEVTARNGGGTGGANHSGTCALAIRYDGV